MERLSLINEEKLAVIYILFLLTFSAYVQLESYIHTANVNILLFPNEIWFSIVTPPPLLTEGKEGQPIPITWPYCVNVEMKPTVKTRQGKFIYIVQFIHRAIQCFRKVRLIKKQSETEEC